MTLEQINLGDFTACVGQPFQIECEGQAVAAELTSATGLGFQSPDAAGRGKRESFTLLFRAPRSWRSSQGIYRVSHPKIGALEVFLVPLGPDEKGMRLEAIFNFV